MRLALISALLLYSCHSNPPAPTPSVTLTWTLPTVPGCSPVPGCLMYVVMRSLHGMNNYVQVGETSLRTYTDATVVSGNSYDFVVKAVNQYGISPASNVYEETIQAP